MKDVFINIYKQNLWGGNESISGTGSSNEQTKTIQEEIKKLVNELDIKSICDIPCGDFNWMKNVVNKNIKYAGYDIVDELIERNNKKYINENISFKYGDVTNIDYGDCDLIICRDCFVHLNYESIFKAIECIKKSSAKYFLTTSFIGISGNDDIPIGNWRTIDLIQAPFNQNKFVKIINENCTEDNGIYSNKSLILYRIEDLKC